MFGSRMFFWRAPSSNVLSARAFSNVLLPACAELVDCLLASRPPHSSKRFGLGTLHCTHAARGKARGQKGRPLGGVKTLDSPLLSSMLGVPCVQTTPTSPSTIVPSIVRHHAAGGSCYPRAVGAESSATALRILGPAGCIGPDLRATVGSPQGLLKPELVVE